MGMGYGCRGDEKGVHFIEIKDGTGPLIIYEGGLVQFFLKLKFETMQMQRAQISTNWSFKGSNG